MLAVARRLAGQAGTANARFVRGDAQARPLRHAAFDVVISNFGVMFFGDPRAAFASLGATVGPRGRLVFLCWQDETRNELFSIPSRAFGAHMRLPGPSAGDLFADPARSRSCCTERAGRAFRSPPSMSRPGWGPTSTT